MAHDLRDKTGEAVTVAVEHADPIDSYVVRLTDGSAAGRADFIDAAGDEARIFFHTEVDPEFGGRGLAGLLLRVALSDSIRDGRSVVPMCPLFARELQRNGIAFVADGGRFRQATLTDTVLVTRHLQQRAAASSRVAAPEPSAQVRR